MHFYVLLFAIALHFAAGQKDRKFNEILEHIKSIEERMTKVDRVADSVVSIEQNVDKLNDKIDRIMKFLEIPATQPIGRSDYSTGVSTGLFSNMDLIQNRLQSLELSVNGMEESMKKLDFDPRTMNEIETRTTQLKDDMNIKLRKIMNILTTLYELNKKKSEDSSRSETPEPPKTEASSTFATEFFMENLDELERKIKEQFSVLTSELRSEVTSLKIVASSAGANCQTSTPDDEEDDDWLTPKVSGRASIARSLAGGDNSLDNLMESLGRSTREIREEIQQGIQGIDTKLQNLTALAHSQPRCDPLETSESIAIPRRMVMPPQQSLEKSDRRYKAERCTKTVQNVPNPKSCADLKRGGATCDGIYVIFPKGRRAVRVLCDMTTDGGGWTVILRRGDYGEKMNSFHKNWLSYKNGFGDTEGEFWLGNDVISSMTSEEPNMLRIHLSAFDDDETNLDYSSFAVGNESSFYRLHLGPPLVPSTVANSLNYHNNHPFSTFDKKNDDFNQNCAATYRGGWWFNGCYFAFLTGEYFNPSEKRENWQGMLWYDWKGNEALKGAEMLIRPKNFTSLH